MGQIVAWEAVLDSVWPLDSVVRFQIYLDYAGNEIRKDPVRESESDRIEPASVIST